MVAILDNLRSIANIGSIFRSADGLGVDKLYLCGTTPHPHPDEPWRRDHLALKKTALGAEQTVAWEYCADTLALIRQLQKTGVLVIALETAPGAHPLSAPPPALQVRLGSGEVAIVVGNEVTGLNPKTLKATDYILAIPMLGHKESLNVAVTFGIAAFWLINARQNFLESLPTAYGSPRRDG